MTSITPFRGSKIAVKHKKERKKITIKYCLPRTGLEPAISRELVGRSNRLRHGTDVIESVNVCNYKSITFLKILIKENEIYNIKTRLHLGLFSVKTLLQPSFALADMIFTNISPRGF